jgi:predicted SnoaL-like aldol condensation-catalyzing enzyme
MKPFDTMTNRNKNIVDYYAQHMANVTDSQRCMVKNDMGGIDIKPLRIVEVVNNPDLIGIVSPYYDPLSNQRTSDSQWMRPTDYLELHKFNKLTGKH